MEGFALNNIQNCYVGSTPATAIYLGSNKIWPTTPHDYSQDYLTFTALEDTTFTFTQNALQYSLDNGNTWTTLAANTASPTVTAGNKILWKQTGLTPVFQNGIGIFSATGNFDASGNIMSLYYGDNFVGQTDLSGKSSAFDSLFYNCNKLINAENLILPANTLEEGCYQIMFSFCSSLVTAPELPATTLKRYCYSAMFGDCSSLVTAPVLPATILADNCYEWMFMHCSSLTTAPTILPATTLTEFCYYYMFVGCTSLTTAPELPATTLTYHCYDSMVRNCTNLNYIKMLATDISASDCLDYWVERVSSTGTFIKNAAMTTLPTGIDGVPSGWTLINA